MMLINEHHRELHSNLRAAVMVAHESSLSEDQILLACQAMVPLAKCRHYHSKVGVGGTTVY